MNKKTRTSISINRNIMECKAQHAVGVVSWLESINRNIMECKDFHTLLLAPCQIRINRNIMECKDLFNNSYFFITFVLIET